MEHKITLTFTENKNGLANLKVEAPLLNMKSVIILLDFFQNSKDRIIDLIIQSFILKEKVHTINIGEKIEVGE